MMAAAALTLVACCCGGCPPLACIGADELLLADMMSVAVGYDVAAANDYCYDTNVTSNH